MSQPRIVRVEADLPSTLRIAWRDGSQTRHDVAGLISRADWAAPLRDPVVFANASVEDRGLQIVWPGTDIAFSAHGLWDDVHPPQPAAAWMSAADFAHWMREMGWSFAEAAEALGVSKRMLKYYSAGTHAVPKAVCLACMHLASAQAGENGRRSPQHQRAAASRAQRPPGVTAKSAIR
jgi:hypothetical protein